MRWLLATALAFIASMSHAQSPCEAASVTRLASTARQLDTALLRQNVKDMWTDVPTPVQRSIARLKDALTAVADQSMRCASSDALAASLQSRLVGLLHANAPEKPFNPDELESVGGYGTKLRVTVTTPANAPEIRLVTISFGIQCGDDSVLLLYSPESDGWRRIMRWQSKSYKEVSGAIGDFVVSGVMPAAGPTPMRLVVAHGTPWCTSRFSEFEIDLLEPGADLNNPRVVWSMGRGYSRGDAEEKLRITGDVFELRLNVAAFDLDTFETPVIFRYRVSGDTVTRIEPIARNGRGFVDEWLEMPWDEARGQVNQTAVEQAKRVHDQFAAPVKATEKSFLNHTDGPVRSCRGEEHEFQVEVGNTRETFIEGVPGGRTDTLPSTYFHIRETGSGYELEGIGTSPDLNCKGPDLMPPKPQ